MLCLNVTHAWNFNPIGMYYKHVIMKKEIEHEKTQDSDACFFFSEIHLQSLLYYYHLLVHKGLCYDQRKCYN